jgi:hypothetical protein
LLPYVRTVKAKSGATALQAGLSDEVGVLTTVDGRLDDLLPEYPADAAAVADALVASHGGSRPRGS